MNLSKLDGFGRVQTQTPPQFAMDGKLQDKIHARRAKRAARRAAAKAAAQKKAVPNRAEQIAKRSERLAKRAEAMPMRAEQIAKRSERLAKRAEAMPMRAKTKRQKRAQKFANVKRSQTYKAMPATRETFKAAPFMGRPKTKRQARMQKLQRMQGAGFSDVEVSADEGWQPDIGFSRINIDNAPGSEALQGFGRIKYTNKELQGLSLEGFTILQGYAMGDEDDLEDWNYLLSIEHPDTMQGFPSWVLNGKKERKARQAARKAKRAQKKAARQQKQQQRQTQRSGRKAARQQKKAARDSRAQRRKEVRTARKEERLKKKQQRREQRAARKEERRARKQQRLDDRKQRQLERQETKRQRIASRLAAKAERGGMFRDIAEGALPFAQQLLTGEDDFEDFSIMDFDTDELPDGFDDYIDQYRNMPSEDVLSMRDRSMDDMDDILIDEPFDEDDFELDSKDAEDLPEKSNMMVPLLAVGALAFAASQKGKKKKRK